MWVSQLGSCKGEPMKILYVTTISNTINAFLIPHIKMLINKGHEVHIACAIEQELSKELTALCVNVHRVSFSRSIKKMDNVRAFKDLKSILIREKFDLIHTHTPIASVITRFANIGMKSGVVYTAHGFHFHKGAPFSSWLIYYPIEWMMAKFTDAIITINQEDYEMATRRFAKKTRVFKVNGIGINLEKKNVSEAARSELRNQYNYSNDQCLLFYAAELNKNKNQKLLIQVMRILNQKHPNVKLILAGSGPCETEYKELADVLNVKDAVDFVGYRTDVENYLQFVDIVVASSKREGLPVNIMEAMLGAKPIVLTDNRGHRELVENGKNGFIVEQENPEQFAEYIAKLCSSKKLREELGENGSKMVTQFSLEIVLDQLNEVYDSILHNL